MARHNTIKKVAFTSGALATVFFTFFKSGSPAMSASAGFLYTPPDSIEKNSDYGLKDRQGDYITDDEYNPFDLDDPDNIDKSIEYDIDNNEYIIQEKIGKRFYRDPNYLSFEEYLQLESERSKKEYWKQLSDANSLLNSDNPPPKLRYEEDENADRIFGSNLVEIRPQGNVDLTFGWKYQNIQNPSINERARKYGAFNFDMDIRMNVQGKIGELLKVNLNYNSKASFDFENQLKLNYSGDEDAIIQSLEAGNISFPLSSSLINGGQNLFGLKTKLKFGRLTVTNVISRKESNVEQIQIQGGAQRQTFAVEADNYDANRHYFLAQYFRDKYNSALSTLPIISSQANITRVEVWVTNRRGFAEDARDIVALMDLAENEPFRDDVIMGTNNELPYAYSLNTERNSNDLYSRLINNSGVRSINTVVSTLEGGMFNLEQIQDFEKTYARKLSESEYELQPQLGYISLNLTLNSDEVLAVAYEYTFNGETYQVGEFAQDIPQGTGTPQMLILKMLKSTSIRPDLPMWDLMMKNIYSIGGYRISPEDFNLNVLYLDPGGGERRYIPEGEGVEGVPLIQLLNLDNLNNQGDNMPDGMFDFIEGITIRSNNGRIIFPLLEPFGKDLYAQFDTNDPRQNRIAQKYIYSQLYDSTQFVAQQYPEFNRYVIKGDYKSSVSSDISLGAFNIPKGSVKVTAGGQVLTENVDYTVDYNIGRIKIINDGILNSGVPINVSYESNDLFGFNQKTMFGSRFDYWVNDDITLGATILKLSERPWTQKVNVGDDPISNTAYGIDGQFKKESNWLTRAIDKLPFVSTKEPSSVSLTGEIARLQPGHGKAVGKEGTAYIDDFEGTTTMTDLKFPNTAWQLSSTPRNARGPNGNILFPEASLFDTLAYGYNRAKLAWYSIEPSLIRENDPNIPDYIKNNNDLRSSHYVREIFEQEIFPQRSVVNTGIPNIIRTLDLNYFPNEKGPYNFAVQDVNPDGTLQNPEDNWGGIMRQIFNTNFETSNVEFIEFWMMDPYLENPNHTGGDMYINLGNISEDILKDSRRIFENGLPKSDNDVTANVDTTVWGIVPNKQSVVNAFDSDPQVRENQDVGLDGLSDTKERDFYNEYLNSIQSVVNPAAYNEILADPAGDNYRHYRDEEYNEQQVPITRRYKEFNGPDGNSPVTQDDQQFSTAATNIPDNEDVNNDNTLNESEEYYQYRVSLRPSDLNVGENYIVNRLDSVIEFDNGTSSNVTWYQFRIPITNYDSRIGNIQDFRSIRFIRMFLTEFQDSVICRFATLDLVRNQWRRYTSLLTPGEVSGSEEDGSTLFNVNAVSLEEQGSKEPVNYVIPNDIFREQTLGGQTAQTIFLNEQSLSTQVCGLKDGDARAAFKTLNMDLRNFKRIKMFMHAESVIGERPLDDGDVNAFIRLGSDFTANYYEYEVPLKITPPGNYNNDNTNDKDIVWPEANEVDITLDLLTNMKQLRSDANYPINIPFTIQDELGRSVTIVGNPDLGNAEVAMLGVRNPKVGTTDSDDDGLPICTEVWFNELRLEGFFEQGGWAALGRLDVKLADIGNVTLSGNFHTIGWGSLEQQLAQRSQDNYYQYDIATSLELSKFLPQRIGIRLPMYAGISESFSNPRFDPYQSDVLFKTIIENADTKQEADSLKELAQTYTSIKSLNFTNVRKVKLQKDAKSHFYDVENISLTYAYSEIFNRNPLIEQDLIKQYKAGLTYGFAPKEKFFEPFKNSIQDKNLSLIKDFNFNLMPNTVSFRTEMNRQFGERILRKQNPEDLPVPPTYNKFFTWDRYYGLKYKPMKSITVDFNAVNNARIDEPFGRIDTDEKKQEVLDNIYDFGRTTRYNQTTNIGYNLPLSKIKALDWVGVQTKYGTSYDWLSVRPFTADSVGNTIQNNQNQQLNIDFKMNTLYDKSEFLKKYSSSSRSRRRSTKKKDEEEKENKLLEFTGRFITSVKSISFNYSEDKSTILPGFAPRPEYLGMDWSNQLAPDPKFTFGYQPDRNWLVENSQWLTTVNSLTYQLAQTDAKNTSIRSNIEPIKDMRIDLNFKKTRVFNHSEFFTLDSLGQYSELSTYDAGSFSTSIITWRTAFDRRDTADGISNAFKQFEENRAIISQRLAEINENSDGVFTIQDSLSNPNYADGYGPYSQDVLIPAFLAAYRGKNASDYPLGLDKLFRIIPLPNWRINYTGLSKLPFIKEYITSLNITHSYSSTFTMGSYVTNLQYMEDNNGNANVRDPISGNFMTKYKVPQVSISEDFSPLLGINITWKNNLTNRIDIKRSKSINMSFLNYQMTETKTSEFTFGVGYRYKGLKLPLKNKKGKQVVLKNDLNFKLDFSIRDNVSIIYQLDQNLAEPTRGVRIISLSPSIDYVVNDRINVRLFFDRRKSIPATTNAFPATNANMGVTIRFTLTP